MGKIAERIRPVHPFEQIHRFQVYGPFEPSRLVYHFFFHAERKVKLFFYPFWTGPLFPMEKFR